MRRFSLAILAALILGCACSVQPPPLPRSPSEQPAVPFRVPPRDISDEPFPPHRCRWRRRSRSCGRRRCSTWAFPARDQGVEIQAFNVVLEQPDSRDRFHRLSRESRAPGRLYALCGLLLVARGEGSALRTH